MRIFGLSAPCAPAAGYRRVAKAGPLAQVGLAQNNGAGVTQALDDEGIVSGGLPDQCQRTCAGLHGIGRLDIVFEQNRDAVQRAPHLAKAAFLIPLSGNCQCIGVQFNNLINGGAVFIQAFNTIQQVVHHRYRCKPLQCVFVIQLANTCVLYTLK